MKNRDFLPVFLWLLCSFMLMPLFFPLHPSHIPPYPSVTTPTAFPILCPSSFLILSITHVDPVLPWLLFFIHLLLNCSLAPHQLPCTSMPPGASPMKVGLQRLGAALLQFMVVSLCLSLCFTFCKPLLFSQIVLY